MEAILERMVWARAGDRCEYCLIPQSADDLHKGPNLSGRDRETRAIVRLFHPRRQKWNRHFRWHGAVLVGLTAVGRATVATLGMNLPHRVELRETLIAEGVFPP